VKAQIFKTKLTKLSFAFTESINFNYKM